MSAYDPPSNPSLSTFNTSNWQSGADTNMTQALCDARYLKLKGGQEVGPVYFYSNLYTSAVNPLRTGANVTVGYNATQTEIASNLVGYTGDFTNLSADTIIASDYVSGPTGTFNNLYSSGNTTLGSTTLYIDASSRRVGVGTGTCLYDLEVIGNQRITGNVACGGLGRYTSTMYVDSVNKRVGFKTGDPVETIDANGNIKFSGTLYGPTGSFTNVGATNVNYSGTLQGPTGIFTTMKTTNTDITTLNVSGTSTLNGTSYLGGVFSNGNYLEVGSASNTLYLDLHSGGANDYDVRIISQNNGGTTAGKGNCTVTANTFSVLCPVNISSGNSYKINGNDVLSANYLGTGCTGSNLQSFGTLTSLQLSGGQTGTTLYETDINYSGTLRGPTGYFTNLTSTAGCSISGVSKLGISSAKDYVEIDSTTNTSFIDFHSGYNDDFDTRIISSGGITGTYGSGTLGIVAGTTNISGNVAFDTSTLYVDATNNKVGIGTASPTTTCEINASSGDATLLIGRNSTTQRMSLFQSGSSGYIDITGDYKLQLRNGDTNTNYMLFDVSSTSQYLKYSGDVGISGVSSTSAFRFGYPTTQTSGSVSSLNGPFVRTSGGWVSCSGGTSVDFALVVPTGTDNWAGTFHIYWKSTQYKRTGAMVYAINKVSGLTAYAGMNLLHNDVKNNDGNGDYSSTISAGTGDIVTWTTTGATDYYCWMLFGAC